MSLTALHLLGGRPAIAGPFEHTIRTYAVGGNAGDFADSRTQPNPTST